MAQFENEKEIIKWLEKQPTEVAVAMAYRAAMRDLPRWVGVVKKDPQRFAPLTLSLFWATSVCLFARSMPNRQIAGSARSAYSAAFSAVSSAARSAASSAALSAAESAAFSAASYAAESANYSSAYSSAYSAVLSAVDSAARSFTVSAARSALSADSVVVEQQGHRFLLKQPLWLTPPPTIYNNDWGMLRQALLQSDPNWTYWIKWYEAARDGRQIWPEELFLRIMEAIYNLYDNNKEEVVDIPKALADVANLVKESQKPLAWVEQIPKSPEPGIGFVTDGEVIDLIERRPEIDQARLNQLLPAVKDVFDNLQSAFANQSNAFPLLTKSIDAYCQELNKSADAISFSTLYFKGLNLELFNEHDQINIAKGNAPELDGQPATALKTALFAHGSLMMLSEEARQIAKDQAKYNDTRQQLIKQEKASIELLKAASSEDAPLTDRARDHINEVVSLPPPPDDGGGAPPPSTPPTGGSGDGDEPNPLEIRLGIFRERTINEIAIATLAFTVTSVIQIAAETFLGWYAVIPAFIAGGWLIRKDVKALSRKVRLNAAKKLLPYLKSLHQKINDLLSVKQPPNHWTVRALEDIINGVEKVLKENEESKDDDPPSVER